MTASHDAYACRLAPLLLVLAACSVDPAANNRYHKDPCPAGTYRGFCKERPDASVDLPDSGVASGDGSASVGGRGDGGGGSSGKGDAGRDDAGQGGDDITGQPCSSEDDTDPCYTGRPGSDQFGSCRQGMRTCKNHAWGECLRQVLPQPEMCNNADDDCDDSTDEDLESFGTCTIVGAACGAVLSCVSGTPVCAGSADPAAETCNGKDDDCDDKTDEQADQPCASGNGGCADDGSGGFECKGICKAGVRHCASGVLKEECEGQVKPKSEEVCNAAGPATDDDCNGSADDSCACSAGDSQPCYNGPANTLDPDSACHAGTQSCVGGKWGACSGEQGPVDETCANPNSDDDCNGAEDDVPMLGTMCTTQDPGICHTGMLQCSSGQLRCATRQAVDEICNTLDDDCDGKTDEAFNLQTDKNNCGKCGMKCTDTQTCCGGVCADTRMDDDNCGACGSPCGSGVSCCSSLCKILQNNAQNCGACGHVCGPDQQCCGTACFNTQTDEAHCGSCTHACQNGATCCAGACKVLTLGSVCIL